MMTMLHLAVNGSRTIFAGMTPRKRPDMPGNPAPFVRDLRTARQYAVNVQMEVRPFSSCYVAASDMMKAVDRLAEMLTGEADYFHADGTCLTGPRTQAEKMEREAGRLPWRVSPQRD